jgi:hypothetical protein
MLLSCSSLMHAQERDHWFVLVHNEQPLVSSHLQVAGTDDGRFRYEWETRATVNFMGQLQVTTVSTEILVSRDLRPLSFRSETTVMSGSSTIQGELVGNTFTTTSLADGVESSEQSLVAADQTLLIDSCLGEWLVKRPPEMGAVTLQVIDDSTWTVRTLTATEQPAQGDRRRWSVEYLEPAYTLGLEVGADGFETERIYASLGLTMQRCSKEEAEAIEPSQQTGRAVLVFPLDRPVPHRHLLTDLTVELRWKDIPFEDFELEDDRQRLLEHSQDGEGFRALVNIFEPEPVRTDVGFPVDEEGLQQFLDETEYIKPHDAAIHEVALEVTRGKSNALQAVQALSSWVNDYVEGALITETLSGPQVLERKTGKCTEYSTLFASLARSVGIPTRIALGERMVADIWGGHMWNEVYVGRWIPVDASVDEVGTSFALLKFIHSDTVAGTQPLRVALTASLDISIRGFEIGDSPLADEYETGIAGNVYTSAEFACRLKAPRPEWTLHDVSEPNNATIQFKIAGADGMFIHFVAFVLPAGTPTKALADSRIEQYFRPSYDGFELSLSESISVGEASGHRSSFGGIAKGDATSWGITECIWAQGSFGFILNMVAPRAKHDEHLAAFDDLLGSFEFLENG